MPSSKYSIPTKYIYKVVAAMLLNGRRSFKEDAQLALSGEHPQLKIIGKENIPATGPCMILMNHYSRPGYIPIWSAFSISSQLPMESHWLMTYAWTSPNKFWDTYKRRLTRILFTSICKVYGFIPMPPMPPDPQEVIDRAMAVRTLMALVRQNFPIAIGMAPEGRDFPNAILGQPPSGMGRLLEQLTKYINNVIPVGVYEENGLQVIHFGKPISLKIKGDWSNEEKDYELSRQVMCAIAALLPDRLRGEFNSNE